ncbi:MAG: glycosyltransferase [Aquificaceae bacterium]
MKLFFLINSLASGGAERVAFNLSKTLPIEKVFLLEKEVNYDLSQEKLSFLSDHSKGTSPIFKTLFIPIYAKRFASKVGKGDLVVSFLERANYVNIIAKFFSKHKALISVRMSQVSGRSPRHPYNLLSRWLYPRADGVICVSKAIAEELNKHYQVPQDKLKVIYNPIYTEEVQALAKEDVGEYSKLFLQKSIITAGRLTKAKGQWHLLRVFRELKEAYSDLKLIMLGDGELKGYLVELSSKLGLKTFVWDRDTFSEAFDVYFLGFQKNPFKFISRSSLFVFPSLWEGFGNVLIEAMACGVPVVSSDCRSGPREILAPDTDFRYQTEGPELAKYGVLMPVFDGKFKDVEPLDKKEKMWLEFLVEFLKREELLKDYAQRGMERARDFDVKSIIKEWEKVLC